VGHLPYGLRRLVELGIALALEPKVLLPDEPAAGVPSHHASLIHEVVDRLPKDIAILLVEHDLELVFSFAQAIIVLAEGAILRNGTPETIAADEEVLQNYLGEAA
jgi:branched-chain amino acid transport system ATP-binding protein